MDNSELNRITKVRISIGASSTMSLTGSMGPPLDAFCPLEEPAAFHTSLFFSISSRSWLALKLISLTFLIFLPGNSFFNSTLVTVDRSLSSSTYNQTNKTEGRLRGTCSVIIATLSGRL
nr:hypothetical protein VIGAN_10151400 [Ipomoea batatas]